jgi:Undecaprenyl-phosphate galactose phosphotransferase WbaP
MSSPLLIRSRVSIASDSSGVQIPFPSLLGKRAQRFKRLTDIFLALFLGLLALPFGLVAAAAIVIESGAPVFFTHQRLGRGRRTFRLWKFRTMVPDGEEVLAAYFAEHPGAALEWERTHKLREDPRITNVGRFLRRTSLDELPQLWNVLKGEMSLVGPRPIVTGEVAEYGSAYVLYAQVAPGLTGLWQVSGRNDTSYRHRVELETRYIRHWTPAMDLGILLRTIPVVLTGKGAY